MCVRFSCFFFFRCFETEDTVVADDDDGVAVVERVVVVKVVRSAAEGDPLLPSFAHKFGDINGRRFLDGDGKQRRSEERSRPPSR